MKTLFTFALTCAVLAAVASSALAFQEQQSGTASPAGKAAPVAPETGAPTLDLGSEDAPKPQDGTEVNIPGLGKLGVLPKMDFGLELLYGAAEGKAPEPGPSGQTEPEDLTVRGSLKHQF